MSEENIEVRDLRHQEWLWTSKNLLFHKSIDEKMYKVYSGLAAYANNQTQKAFPSIGTLMEKLHMGRNTVIRALQKLEQNGFISVVREQGSNNIYSLLEVEGEKTLKTKALADIKTDMPSQTAKTFFKGIQDLSNKVVESSEGQQVKLFLLSLAEKYPKANKALIWDEVKKFERYWTELNATGTKERWQKEPVFQIERRLVTWFSKKDQFKKVDITKNNKRIV